MDDSPPVDEVLEAVARTLGEQVLPAVRAEVAHTVRVSAHLCRLVARELRDSPDPVVRSSISEALGLNGDVSDSELATALDHQLRQDDPDFDRRHFDLILSDVERRADIAKPNYRNPNV